MPLQVQEIQNLLENPANRAQIQKAIAHENRIKLHTETVLSRQSARGANEFLNFVRSLIPSDKYAIFMKLFRFPVKTNELTEKIFTALGKVFDGQNPVYDCNFLTGENETDWLEYKEGKKEFRDWQINSLEVMATSINSLVVVDVMQEQLTSSPEPYFYFLDVSSVLDYKCNDEGFAWIMFKQKGDRLAIFCDGYYRIFKTKQGTNEIEALLFEGRHELGYCPVNWFWSDNMNRGEKGTKKSPISTQLEGLDWLLFFSISKQHLDLYASYPIYSAYEKDCDFEDNESGNHCYDGFLKDRDGNYIFSSRSGGVMPCPICSTSRLTGAGSFIEIPVPDNETADLRNPVQITTIDRSSLDYNVGECDRIEKKIYQSVTGYGGEMPRNKAVNEKQVIASFESRTAVLNKVKRNFETIQQWIEETVCRLRYGSNFLNCNINLGSEFYLYSASELLEMYENAKEKGWSDAVLDMLHEQYIKTKYRNNPEQLQRQKILSSLNPFNHLKKSEVRELYNANQITYEQYMLKMNFSTFIMRFERENININQFGSLVSFDAKIKSIAETLRGYAAEMRPVDIEPQTIEP